jgi:hypothetical protein
MHECTPALAIARAKERGDDEQREHLGRLDKRDYREACMRNVKDTMMHTDSAHLPTCLRETCRQ